MAYIATAQFNHDDINSFADGDTVDAALASYIADDLRHYVNQLRIAGRTTETVEIRVYTSREHRDGDYDEHDWYLDQLQKTVFHDVSEILMEVEEEYGVVIPAREADKSVFFSDQPGINES